MILFQLTLKHIQHPLVARVGFLLGSKKLLCYRIYERITEEPLNRILMEEIENMGEKLAGVIAISRKEYGFFSNGSMAVDTHEF